MPESKQAHGALIVLSNLLEGGTVTVCGWNYRIVDGDLQQSANAEVWFRCDLTLRGFLRLAQKLSFDDLFLISANTALLKHNRRPS